MTTLAKRSRLAKISKLRKLQICYRILTKKEEKPNETEISLGFMVIVNGLGELQGRDFATATFSRTPEYYYELERNFNGKPTEKQIAACGSAYDPLKEKSNDKAGPQKKAD